MARQNPYLQWVEGLAAALRAGAAIGAPTGAPIGASAPPAAGSPKALLFAPHPDDEVIVGGLPLRLMRECGFAVADVAVTLGSNRDRQPGRRRELEAACRFIGFGLVVPGSGDLDGTSPETLAALLAAERPDIVFLPHAADWNRTHIAVHDLVLAAMRRVPALTCLVVETEFWGAMTAPNLMIESSPADVADLVAALSLHVGEVARNPYHLRLPAWMMDNVRRGAELVGGQGGPAPDFAFATLYRLRRWRDGALHDLLDCGRIVSAADDLNALFAREG